MAVAHERVRVDGPGSPGPGRRPARTTTSAGRDTPYAEAAYGVSVPVDSGSPSQLSGRAARVTATCMLFPSRITVRVTFPPTVCSRM